MQSSKFGLRLRLGYVYSLFLLLLSKCPQEKMFLGILLEFIYIYLRRRASSRTVGLYIFYLLPFQQVPRRGKILGYFINLSKHLSRAAATLSGLYMFCLCVFLAIAPHGKFFRGILTRPSPSCDVILKWPLVSNLTKKFGHNFGVKIC